MVSLWKQFILKFGSTWPTYRDVASAPHDTGIGSGRCTVRANTHTIVCLLWAGRGLASPLRWLIYSLLLSVKQLTDGENSAASATLSPLLDALQFHQWQECWRLLLKFDGKVNSYHKNVTLEHTLYCFVPVMTIEPEISFNRADCRADLPSVKLHLAAVGTESSGLFLHRK